jgi:hypothetical protein
VLARSAATPRSKTRFSLSYMPPVNQMVKIGTVPHQQPWFPTNLFYCSKCELVQLGLAVDPVIIFPPEYPYTSGMTKLCATISRSFTPSHPRCWRSKPTTSSSISAPMTAR